MIRTHFLKCQLSKAQADALNRGSGRIYSQTLIWHWRIYRRTGHWLSSKGGQRLNDFLCGLTTLHAHSRDAAQQGFYRASKTARANGSRYPHKRKRFRTTIWKNTSIRKRGKSLLLSRARGLEPITVPLPDHLANLSEEAFREVRLVWDNAARYNWHLVVEDGQEPKRAPGKKVAACDLGEIHPAAPTDGEEVVISARALRSLRQYTAKRLAELQHLMASKVKGSRQWRGLQRRKNRFLAIQKRRLRDMLHKVSRALVEEAVRRRVGTLVIGDVRDVANGKRMHEVSQQKISMWPHSQMRWYTTYKAEVYTSA